MRLIWLVSLCGLTLGQDDPTTPVEGNVTKETTPRPTWYGPDWVPMVGGTELPDVVYPQAVPIKQNGQLVNGFDNFDCFAVIAGRDSRTKRDLFTSGLCQVAGYISKKYGELGEAGIDIKLTRHPYNSTKMKRQTAVRKTRPFNIDYYTFENDHNLNETTYYAGELILDKRRFESLMELGSATPPAIALASTPYKAAAVKIVGNCSNWYSQIYLPHWPEIMPEGVFCVTTATGGINAHIANGVSRQIQPGVPCLDSLGSPVLIGEKFNEVLGVVVVSTCDFAIPSGVDVPQFALAVSMAHGLDWDFLPLPSGEPFLSVRTSVISLRTQDVSPVVPYEAGNAVTQSISRAFPWAGAIFWVLNG